MTDDELAQIEERAAKAAGVVSGPAFTIVEELREDVTDLVAEVRRVRSALEDALRSESEVTTSLQRVYLHAELSAPTDGKSGD